MGEEKVEVERRWSWVGKNSLREIGARKEEEGWGGKEKGVRKIRGWKIEKRTGEERAWGLRGKRKITKNSTRIRT